MKARPGRLAEQRGHRVASDALLPAQLEAWRCQDHGCVRMDLTDVLDQRPGTLRIAACPDVVDEHVSTLGEIARVSREDGTPIPGRPTAFDDVVAETAQRIGLLAGEIEVVMHDKDASHVTPPRGARRPVRVGRVSTTMAAGPWLSGEGHLVGHLAPGSVRSPEGEHGSGRRFVLAVVHRPGHLDGHR